MGHRRRKQKKNFKCGHRGFGQYCHLCGQIKNIEDIQPKEILTVPNVEEPVQIENIETKPTIEDIN